MICHDNDAEEDHFDPQNFQHSAQEKRTWIQRWEEFIVPWAAMVVKSLKVVDEHVHYTTSLGRASLRMNGCEQQGMGCDDTWISSRWDHI